MLFLVGQGIFLLVGNGLGTHGKNGFVCLRKPQARRRNRRRRARTHSITHGRKNVNPFLEGPRKAAGELATKDFVDVKIHALEVRLVRWIIETVFVAAGLLFAVLRFIPGPSSFFPGKPFPRCAKSRRGPLPDTSGKRTENCTSSLRCPVKGRFSTTTTLCASYPPLPFAQGTSAADDVLAGRCHECPATRGGRPYRSRQNERV